ARRDSKSRRLIWPGWPPLAPRQHPASPASPLAWSSVFVRPPRLRHTGLEPSSWHCDTADLGPVGHTASAKSSPRSEEHTSELQSRFDLVCRLLPEKKKNNSATLSPNSDE